MQSFDASLQADTSLSSLLSQRMHQHVSGTGVE